MSQTAPAAALLAAIEMSNRTWKLGFQFAGRRRFVDVPARDLCALRAAIAEAQERLSAPAEARVQCCFEAGRDGFWLHRALISFGFDNVVIDAASIEVDRRARRAKTDSIDVQKMLSLLARYAAGEPTVWSVVRVPSLAVEDERRDTRERDRLANEIRQHSSRIRSLLVASGVDVTVSRKFVDELESIRLWDGSALPPRLKQELVREHARWMLLQEQLGELDRHRRALLKPVEGERGDSSDLVRKVERLQQLRGVGERGAWKLVQEYFWREFKNRRQVGAAAGLTGTPYSSGDSDREQGISKAGNRRIRALMVELSWCWLRLQPDSALSLWFHQRFGDGKRMRKVGIVALARRLLIALWRYVEAGVVPDGALLKTAAAKT